MTSPICICCFLLFIILFLFCVLNLACFHFQCGKPTSISSQCQFDEVSSCSCIFSIDRVLLSQLLLEACKLDSLGVPRREIQTNESIETRLGMAPHSSSFLVSYLFIFVFYLLFFNYFLFDILTAQCHAAAVAPRQRCSDLSRFPENLAWKLLPKEKLM